MFGLKKYIIKPIVCGYRKKIRRRKKGICFIWHRTYSKGSLK